MVCKCIQLLLSFKIMLFDHLGRKSGEIKGRGCAIISVHCSVVKEKSKQIQIPRKRLKSKKKRIFLIQNGTDYKISSHIERFSTNGGWIFQLWHQFYLVSTGNLPSRWVLTNSCSNNQIWRFLIHFSKCFFRVLHAQTRIWINYPSELWWQSQSFFRERPVTNQGKVFSMKSKVTF